MSIEIITPQSKNNTGKLSNKTARAIGKSHCVCVFVYSLHGNNSPSISSLAKLQSFINTKQGWIARIDDDTIALKKQSIIVRTVYVCFPVGQGTKWQGKEYVDIANIIGSCSPCSFKLYYTNNAKIAWQGTGRNAGREKYSVTSSRKQAINRRQQFEAMEKVFASLEQQTENSKLQSILAIAKETNNFASLPDNAIIPLTFTRQGFYSAKNEKQSFTISQLKQSLSGNVRPEYETELYLAKGKEAMQKKDLLIDAWQNGKIDILSMLLCEDKNEKETKKINRFLANKWINALIPIVSEKIGMLDSAITTYQHLIGLEETKRDENIVKHSSHHVGDEKYFHYPEKPSTLPTIPYVNSTYYYVPYTLVIDDVLSFD